MPLKLITCTVINNERLFLSAECLPRTQPCFCTRAHPHDHGCCMSERGTLLITLWYKLLILEMDPKEDLLRFSGLVAQFVLSNRGQETLGHQPQHMKESGAGMPFPNNSSQEGEEFGKGMMIKSHFTKCCVLHIFVWSLFTFKHKTCLATFG